MTNNPVCMLVRNGRAITQQAVESVLAQDIPVELYITNNASTDGTAQYLNSLRHRNLHIIHNYPPHGVAQSWNTQLRSLFANHEHVLVVNNDVILRPDTYSTLLAQGGPFVTAVGVRGDHYNEYERVGGWRGIQLPVFRNAFGGEVFPGGEIEITRTRPHPDFSCYLIRRSVWEQVGEFDEGFKGAYAEDSDYHVRMHRAGVEAVCVDLPFYHVGAGTIKNGNEFLGEVINKQAELNREYFKSKYGCEVGSTEYYHDLFGHDAPEDTDGE